MSEVTPGKRIGITGPRSFIGRSLIARMREDNADLSSFTGDITNPRQVFEFVERNDVIFHLAARNRGPELEVFRINAVGAANVASAVVALGDRHVIYPSSVHVDSHPDTAYSRAKLEAETMLGNISGVRGCKSSVFRLPNVYGPGALPFHVSVVATFCYFKALGRPDDMPIIGDGSQSVELAPINQVVDELTGAMEQEACTDLRYVPGRKMSVAELAHIIRDDVAIKEYPAMAECVAVFSRAHPGTTVHSSEVTADGRHIDLDCVRRSLGESGIKSLFLIDLAAESGEVRRHSPVGVDWVFALKGRMMADIYAEDGSYINSTLLESGGIVGTNIKTPHQYVVRSVDAESGICAVARTDA